LLGDEKRITEAGAMNFFVVVKRDDGGLCLLSHCADFIASLLDLEVITPSLDGTILPGITRMSVLSLVDAHTNGSSILPSISPSLKLYPVERVLTMSDIARWSSENRLVEAFGVGTAVTVIPVSKIGFQGKDIELPIYEKVSGPVAKALFDRITDIQQGRVEFHDWCARCE
jgi:branched-chain amino acid aminotransferase